MPLKNLLIICVAAVVSYACYGQADKNQYVATLVEAMDIVRGEYIEEVDSRELFENAMSGMAEGLDQYSSYISVSDYQQFLEGLDQEFGGVGIIVELNPETKRLTVLSPLHDTPAYRAGIKAGDTIMAIDGNDTKGLSLKDSVGLMRGVPGTSIELSVLHVGEPTPVSLTVDRAIIPIESVLGDVRHDDGTWDFDLQEDPRITYIRLTTFGEHTVEEMRQALDSRDVQALIIDLRDNAGGLLSASVSVCDMFVDKGSIVSTRGRNGQLFSPYDATASTLIPADIPMVVLVNNYSASASEIVAACLQDHQRATIIGQRTWGKGTVQNIIQLQGGQSALKLTTASYWRPSGKNIHRKKDAEDEDEWGVSPEGDFKVELTPEEADQVRLLRREKDAYEGLPRLELPEDEDQDTPKLEDDPQMRKAIDHLQSVLPAKE